MCRRGKNRTDMLYRTWQSDASQFRFRFTYVAFVIANCKKEENRNGVCEVLTKTLPISMVICCVGLCLKCSQFHSL